MMKDLTLLLLVKDRESFSKRWISYFEKSSLNINVLIADGSKHKSDLFNQNKLFDYHYFGPDKDFPTYRNKVIKALEKIKTKYVLFASNDDFYIKNGIQKALTILKKNKKYSSARGSIKAFRVISLDEIYGKLLLYDDLYTYKSIVSNTSSKRILEFVKKSNGLWHDVVKKDLILSAWKNSKRFNFDNIIIHDLYTFFYISAKGKCIRSKYIYMMHQNHINSESHEEKYQNMEFKLAKIISNTQMGKNFLDKIYDLAASDNKNIQYNFRNDFIKLFYYEYILKRIENRKQNFLNKSLISRFKFYLADKYVILYLIYSNLKYTKNIENIQKIKKYNLNLIDDFLAKRI